MGNFGSNVTQGSGWGTYLVIFALGIAFLWTLLSWASAPSAWQQEHELRTASQTEVAVQATRIVVLQAQVPTQAPYPYPGFRP